MQIVIDNIIPKLEFIKDERKTKISANTGKANFSILLFTDYAASRQLVRFADFHTSNQTD